MASLTLSGSSAILKAVISVTTNNGELLSRITLNPKVLVGKPTIRGLRISVEQILLAMASGVPDEDLLRDFPELEPEDLRAAQAYAAQRISEERVFPVGVR